MRLTLPNQAHIDTSVHAVILFDGVCNFCNSSVNWIIQRDRAARFRFASLQSDAAGCLLAPFAAQTPPGDSIVLIDGEQCYTESTAVLRICRYLPFPWQLFAGLLTVPKPVRDPLYRLVARHRYRLWGERESCMIPSAEIRQRFL